MEMQKRSVARWNGIESHTSSRSVTETVNGSHDFLIKGFSLTKGMGIGVPLKSEAFSVGGYEWGIYFYPDGSKLEDNKYVSIFVALLSDATNVRALFELAMLDQSGEDDHKINSHFDRSPDGGPHTLKFKGSMWGFRRYFKRRVLETSRFLKDDCLKIHCVVGVLVWSSMDCSSLKPIEVPESDMGAHFGMLLDDEELSDVTFIVDGEKFYAHKLILTTRSTTFETRFFEGKGLDKSEIVITDVEPRVFKTMLQFIYIDNFLPDEELLRHCSASLESVFESFVSKLLIAADKYGLPRLKSLCEYLLCQDICVETVAYLLAFADCHDAIVLRSKCLEFSADYLDDVLQSEGCKYLKKNCPLLLSELEMMECVQETKNLAEYKDKLTNDVVEGEEEARGEEQNQNVSLNIVDENN